MMLCDVISLHNIGSVEANVPYISIMDLCGYKPFAVKIIPSDYCWFTSIESRDRVERSHGPERCASWFNETVNGCSPIVFTNISR